MHKSVQALAIGMAFLCGTFLSAADTATVTVTINVLAENDITFSGNPAPFNVTPGSPAQDTSTTYGVITNQSNQKITASLASGLPSGVALSVTLAAPTGATSLGAVALTTTAQDLVTGITQISQNGIGVTYNVTATPSAAVANGITDTITYTISS